MKFNLFLILIVLNGFLVKAQHFSNGIVFPGSGTQQIIQTSIDKKGNQYLVILYDSSFTADSVGVPVIIQSGNLSGGRKSYAIIKLDSTGRYVFHLRFHYRRGVNTQHQSINFDENNDMYFFFSPLLGDTVEMFDAVKSPHSLFNKIRPGISSISWISYTLCKITENGQLSWVNTLTYPDSMQPLLTGKLIYFTSGQTIVNHLNEITVHIMHPAPVNNLSDTLHITHSNGIETTMLVKDEDVLIKFSATGILVYAVEPFKHKLQIHTDPVFNRIYKSVTDGHYTYSINRFYLSAADTFRCRTPIPMNTGQNFLLIKSDEHDSIVWAKLIGRGDAHNFVLDYNNRTHEIALGFTCLPYDFVSPYNPYYFSSNFYDFLIAKLDTAGSVKWSKMYIGNDVDAIAALTYNQITNQLLVIGNTSSTDLQLDAFRITKIVPSTHFVAIIDSTNNIVSTQTIQSNSFDLFSRGSNLILGIPVTDQKGHTFIPGWFSDSIMLPCKTLKSPTGTIDGVLLTFNTVIPKDTGVCTKMISPSGRYVWDSSGVYVDTLLTQLGCDSILQFRVTKLQTKSVLDTSVCYRMTSYSGKYNWDSTGTYKDTIPNSKGCDSLITARVRVSHSRSNIDTSVCTTFKSPSGKFFLDSTGTFYDTIPNYRNCDSILKIKLTVLRPKSIIDTSYCRTYISPSGKLSINTSGTYTDTLLNSNGCDSIITIRYTQLIYTDTLRITDCKSLTSPSGKYIYSLTGQYYDTLAAAQGCDSIIVVLYNRNSLSGILNKNTCTSFTSPSGKFIYHSSGTYSDTVLSSTGCDSVVTIQLSVFPLKVEISKSNDVSCDSLYTSLTATPGNFYLWSPSTTLTNATISNPIATPLQSTTYKVVVSDSLGCTTIDSIEVIVNKQETIQSLSNVFTPNNDGKNDCLSLESISGFKQVTFTVFNRWGVLVFTTTNPADCWDGTANTEEVPSGTYFFSVKGTSLCDIEVEQHGTITLIR
ncbi:MAG: gliding motility-associated C-terminal domain-containing protein [Bacteroidota bacterium]